MKQIENNKNRCTQQNSNLNNLQIDHRGRAKYPNKDTKKKIFITSMRSLWSGGLKK